MQCYTRLPASDTVPKFAHLHVYGTQAGARNRSRTAPTNPKQTRKADPPSRASYHGTPHAEPPFLGLREPACPQFLCIAYYATRCLVSAGVTLTALQGRDLALRLGHGPAYRYTAAGAAQLRFVIHESMRHGHTAHTYICLSLGCSVVQHEHFLPNSFTNIEWKCRVHAKCVDGVRTFFGMCEIVLVL